MPEVLIQEFLIGNCVSRLAFSYLSYGMELQQKLYDKFDVLSYPGGNTGVQMGGWFRKIIKSLDDLKGLKMRIPALLWRSRVNGQKCPISTTSRHPRWLSSKHVPVFV